MSINGKQVRPIPNGKWTVRKRQGSDCVWSGSWIASSPWRLENGYYARDLRVTGTWQEALDHANEQAAAR